jgi:nucleoside-diphosphate-sugar epimerase
VTRLKQDRRVGGIIETQRARRCVQIDARGLRIDARRALRLVALHAIDLARAVRPSWRRFCERCGYLQEEIMKVFVAGADGAIGTPLTRLLVARGHEVLGLIRNPAGAAGFRALGGRPVVADALDRSGLLRAVDGLAADAVTHELTALRKPPLRASGMALTNRLRTEGTASLVAAAEHLGAKRIVTQSIILGYGFRDHGDRVLTERDPFGIPAGDMTDEVVAALASAETQTFAAPEGIALRYGLLYGGDAAHMRPMLAKRSVPVSPGGLVGWVHHFDAAAATVAALERGRPGEAYNIVDDRPVTWQEMFTAMAAGFGAPAPRRLPRWLMRVFAPYIAAVALDASMRVSNAKAKADLQWQPRFKTYLDGIAAMASGTAVDATILEPLAAGNRR